MRFKRQFDPNYEPFKGSPNYGDSKTEPDQALTVRQILARMANGVKVDDLHRTGNYTEDHEIPVFDDISDFDRWSELKQQELRANERALSRSERITKQMQNHVEKNSRNRSNSNSGDHSVPPKKGGKGTEETE